MITAANNALTIKKDQIAEEQRSWPTEVMEYSPIENGSIHPMTQGFQEPTDDHTGARTTKGSGDDTTLTTLRITHLHQHEL
ncbi:hypothetical protein HNR23_000341 [Nocardiopsis mwathae]|uniref:Uncharacterized protein n=1 Tax=Nocardiopsis mwathae TaxID=1472723 RepID=A0A7W9YF30_9ACTN|nr:hypothetical protein [Nocardiopsis mwathae]MBB6170281.1 hypothetical protein [Nocardiopsis mwathae]